MLGSWDPCSVSAGKYDIVHLENEALDRLHNDYPTTLKEWDSYDDR
jgi:hypothetical protein